MLFFPFQCYLDRDFWKGIVYSPTYSRFVRVMGAIFSVIDALIRKIGIMSPRDDEEVDSKTGLKVKEKRAMTQSWKYISPNLKAEGMHFFNM